MSCDHDSPIQDSVCVRGRPLTRSKLMTCRGGCGRLCEVGVNTVNPPRCYSCGLQASVSAMMQMSRKEGPVYDRWRAGMRNWLETEVGIRAGTE